MEKERKRWEDMTDEECSRFKKKTCSHCDYFSKQTGDDGSGWSSATCNYSKVTGKCRLCSPLECVERGFFKQKRGKRRRKGVF